VTILGLKVAFQVFDPLEELNRLLQSTSIAVSGMLEAAKMVADQLLQLRTDSTFNQISDEVGVMTEQLVCCGNDNHPTGLRDPVKGIDPKHRKSTSGQHSLPA